MQRRLDTIVGWLMRPKVRRVRRWSFVATLPLGLLIAHLHGVEEGAAIVAARMAGVAMLALVAWRVGGERGDALRDLVMHPRVRAFGRAELDILMALPRMLLARLGSGSGSDGDGGRDGLTYARGTFGYALAFARSRRWSQARRSCCTCCWAAARWRGCSPRCTATC